MNVLAFGAHPDDVEFRCAGTLAKYTQRGDKVYTCVVTDGRIGSTRVSKDEVIAMRRREAQNACDVYGAELIWLGIEDEFLFDTYETRLQFIEAVRIARPDVIFAPPAFADYNPDHDYTGYLAFIARINATIKLITTEHPPTSKVPPMFICTAHSGNDFVPEYYVDITDTIEIKKKAFCAHESQQGSWCKDAFGVDYLDQLVRETKQLASMCGTPGVEYVEGYKLCKSWPIIADAHKLLP